VLDHCLENGLVVVLNDGLDCFQAVGVAFVADVDKQDFCDDRNECQNQVEVFGIVCGDLLWLLLHQW